jgi:hypothetical protein
VSEAPGGTQPAPRNRRRIAWRIALTLALGAAGGTAFYYLRMPLPWMIGAMCVTTAATLAGAPLKMPARLRDPMIAILGVMLGSAFTPEIAERIPEWWTTVAAMAVYLAIVGGLLFYYFRRVAGFDRVTAYFSAAPGGLTEMILVGAAMGGDDRKIALVQAARVLLVVLALPFGFVIFTGYERTGTTPGGIAMADFPLPDVFILGACAVVGVIGAKALRIPAARITGPMVLSAVVHLAGWSSSSPPVELIALAQVVIGCAIGARFVGVPFRQVAHAILLSLGSTTILIAVGLGFAFLMAPYTTAGAEAVMLAFAPGGLAEMSLIALALGIEAAFVATHHIIRIALIVVVAPAVFRGLERRRKKRDNKAKN